LNTVGARAGQSREATLGYFADGDKAWLIVGSVGGAARHPHDAGLNVDIV
jgi:hypothetical protein